MNTKLRLNKLNRKLKSYSVSTENSEFKIVTEMEHEQEKISLTFHEADHRQAIWSSLIVSYNIFWRDYVYLKHMWHFFIFDISFWIFLSSVDYAH